MPNLDYAALLRRLHDLEYLAEPPRPGERAGCFSSYDRRSRYVAEADRYEAWDANEDGSGFIRREGDTIVVFESDGPGVIWRVWSALPGAGHIQIFIDDAAAPVIDMPFRDFFETFGNETPPLNFPELVPTLSRGRNRFIPIPYNRCCKVRLCPEWGAYYHFTYTTFPQDTVLPVLTGAFDRASALALAQTDRLLAERGWKPLRSPGDVLEHVTIEVPAGATVPIRRITGNRAITGLKVRVDDLENADGVAILRELALGMRWDGETEPSVWSPLGDFFGTAPGVNYYRSLPLGMTDAGFYCHWYMPFAAEALLELTNDGAVPRTVSFTICHKPLGRPAGELLRFHAKWHRDALLEQSQQKGREIDWPLLIVQGQGRFCGVHLHVWNRWAEPERAAEEWWYGRWNAKTIDWWWGEGDEKFFVDGEKFPSTFGTGSEDYIGYAWAAEPPFPTFDSAFACQPYVELNANGHTSVNRFQICDNVPFMEQFEGCIEKYKGNRWGDGNYCFYDTVAYWYQKAGQADPYLCVPIAERTGYYGVPLMDGVRLRDVIDSDLPILFEHQMDAEANQMAAFAPRTRDAFMAHWTKILADESNITQTILYDGQVAGNVACFEQGGERDVGYWIGRSYWGRGVATKALSALLDRIESRPLFARVAKHNSASMRVLEKCGFKRVGEESDEFILKLAANNGEDAA